MYLLVSENCSFHFYFSIEAWLGTNFGRITAVLFAAAVIINLYNRELIEFVVTGQVQSEYSGIIYLLLWENTVSYINYYKDIHTAVIIRW